MFWVGLGSWERQRHESTGIAPGARVTHFSRLREILCMLWKGFVLCGLWNRKGAGETHFWGQFCKMRHPDLPEGRIAGDGQREVAMETSEDA